MRIMTVTYDLDDLFADHAIRDPYAFFGRLRETDPVHWNARYQLCVIVRGIGPAHSS